MSFEIPRENSLRSPVYELTEDVWCEKMMLELDEWGDNFQCKRITRALLPAVEGWQF
jgi:hypothetical protein